MYKIQSGEHPHSRFFFFWNFNVYYFPSPAELNKECRFLQKYYLLWFAGWWGNKKKVYQNHRINSILFSVSPSQPDCTDFNKIQLHTSCIFWSTNTVYLWNCNFYKTHYPLNENIKINFELLFDNDCISDVTELEINSFFQYGVVYDDTFSSNPTDDNIILLQEDSNSNFLYSYEFQSNFEQEVVDLGQFSLE